MVRNGRKRAEFVRIGRGANRADASSFSHNNVSFCVVDMEVDDKTREPVVYIQRFGKVERIPCRLGQSIYDPLCRVRFLNSLNAGTFTSSVGGTFKLGSEKTGEETYRIVSADPDTKMTVVESVGESPKRSGSRRFRAISPRRKPLPPRKPPRL